MNPLRIVMLGPFGLHPKGTMRARALPAARALADRGHGVHVLMPPWHTPAEAGRRWQDGGVEVEYVSLDGLDLPGVGHGVVAARLARRALELRPDVVHAFKPKAYSGLAAALLWARRSVGGRVGGSSGGPPGEPHSRRSAAAFALVMDTDDWEGPGGWNDLERYSRAQRAVFARQERWGLTHAHHVTVASRALETLVWSLGVDPRRVTYLPNAVEPAQEIPGIAGAADESGVSTAPAVDMTATSRDHRVLLYTRFHEFDPERPLAVLAALRRQVPDAMLVVAGRGLHGEEQAFLARAVALGLGTAVNYVGWLGGGDEAALFAGVDAALVLADDTLVNRTRSSMKLLDLMAAGLPVVAEAVGQNAAVIQAEVSGRLVPVGDVGGLATALAELLRDPARRQALGQAGRERVEREYSWPSRVGGLEAVYGRALEAARAG